MANIVLGILSTISIAMTSVLLYLLVLGPTHKKSSEHHPPVH
jgi:hypothetical protein